MQISCIKGKPKRIGKGLYREVFRIGDIVLKVEQGKGKSLKKLRERAVEVDSHQRKMRETFDFLPAYHGTVLTGIERNGAVSPVVVTFHEYVKPLPTYSIETLRAIFSLIKEAGEQGYILDIKPSNFGRKERRVFYLDEYGIGKGPLPPDVLEDLDKLVQSVLKKIKSGKPAWPPLLRKRP